MKRQDSQLDLTVCDYEPKPKDRLFHYCPIASFEGILASRSLWLSSFDSLNDSTELKWGRQLVTRQLRKNRSTFDRGFSIAVHATFVQADLNVVPVIFSLSADGDLLSQWRAYASGGAGVAIEFDATRLCAGLPVNTKRILYAPERQDAVVRSSLRSFYSWWSKDEGAATNAVIDLLPTFAFDLLSLKHPTFFEEREVRLIHLLVRDGGSLRDCGGHVLGGTFTEPRDVNRRVVRGREVAYIALPIEPACLISGVVLGPLNRLSVSAMKELLANEGLSNIKVRRSRCPYR